MNSPEEDIKRLTGCPGKLVMLAIFGSHLYGTDTPESDSDVKGVYLPTAAQILAGNIPRSYSYNSKQGHVEGQKNGANDVDIEIYSLHYFFELLTKGETVAIDMIHIKPRQCMIATQIWRRIHDNRHMAYSKNMSAFVGYARKQAAKYGIKGSRLDDVARVVEFLRKEENESRMRDVWEALPTGEHIHKLDPDVRTPHRIYQVIGKRFLETVKTSEVLRSLEIILKEYGHRAQAAKENKGIDWKAVSHAMRAALQMEEILTLKDLSFPLADADLLRDVKNGTQDYTTLVAPALENMMDRVEKLSAASDLPAQVDRAFWNNMLVEFAYDAVIGS